MGGSSRSRRKRANKPKTRNPAKDHAFNTAENHSAQLAEELTALSAIFQDDFTLVSESPFTEFLINVRPHSIDEGVSEQNVFVELLIRCLPGYPSKPPKLQIKAMEGLSDVELHLLHSKLVEQATSISREGRVMVFNLVEATQEFLSVHVESETSNGKQMQQILTTLSPTEDSWIPEEKKAMPLDSHDVELSDVFEVVDLFGDLQNADDGQWGGLQTAVSVQLQSNKSRIFEKQMTQRTVPLYHDEPDYRQVDFNEKLKAQGGKAERDAHIEIGPGVLKSIVKSVIAKRPQAANPTIEEEIEVLSPKDLQLFSVSEILQKVRADASAVGCKKALPGGEWSDSPGSNESGDEQFLPSYDNSPPSPLRDETAASIQKDFLLAHLLRLVCSPRGPLPHALPILVSQLQKFGIIQQWTKDLLVDQPHLFDMAFHQIFSQYIGDKSPTPEAFLAAKKFWSTGPELLGEGGTYSQGSSRYSTDFVELSLLGKGGFGHVVLCKNNLDGRLYAMKKIRLKDKSPLLNNKILREVATLSRLQHHHVVRYYQAWFETRLGHFVGVLDGASEFESSGDWFISRKAEEGDSSFRSLLPQGIRIGDAEEKLVETTYLYIQMEYCPRTLRQDFDSYRNPIEKEDVWRIFRQIVEGLAHIHGQGIIHRDLTPSNIFFDARNQIKIGDFGLAKFTNLEQPDREPLAMTDANGGSLDGTGQIGTYFYTAPEIDQGWPRVDEKVDMYSLGVVLFELWHPFSTAMERHVTLMDLKHKCIPPDKWASEFPQQALLVKRLMSPNPSDRPSALQVLRKELPPRMEDEALNDILRTIQSSDNSYVFDRIIAAIFDEDRICSMGQTLDKKELNFSSVKDAVSQDRIFEMAKKVFTQHGAREFDSSSMSLVDEPGSSNSLKLMSSAGSMLELRQEMRLPFARWVASKQITSLKRFEISHVYRRGVGYSAPSEYLQGDFDMIGGAPVLAEAEVIKVAVDIISKSSTCDVCEIRINHSNILDAIWSWCGVQRRERREVAKLMAVMSGAPPQSSERKSRWVLIRRQLLQGLQLSEAIVDRLQTVERRLSGFADEALSRLRGALPSSVLTSIAFDDLYTLLSHLRVWHLEKNVLIDALMTPSEAYYKGAFFQIHLPKGSYHGISSEGMLIAMGGQYDQLLQRYWPKSMGSGAPVAVGLSIALENLIVVAKSESNGIDPVAEVLVCSKGGGGLLSERMEVAADLWAGDIKAEFLCSPTPSLTEQYEYANEHGIKWLVIITEAGLSHTGSVKVRHLELKVEEDIPRINLVKFFTNLPVTSVSIRKRATCLRDEL